MDAPREFHARPLRTCTLVSRERARARKRERTRNSARQLEATYPTKATRNGRKVLRRARSRSRLRARSRFKTEPLGGRKGGSVLIPGQSHVNVLVHVNVNLPETELA